MRGVLHKCAILPLAFVATVALGKQCFAEQFSYKGRTVTFQIGLAPGGGYDLYARVLAMHLGRHIPDGPTIVSKNMPGAGGLRAANYLYTVAPRDGTEIAMIPMSAIMLALFGDKNAQFQPKRFTWLGSMNDEAASCGVWHTSPVITMQEAFSHELVFGASGVGGITVQHAMVLKNLLGAKVKVIPGYNGTNDVNLAMQRGEVQASCGLFLSALQSHWREDWESGRIKPLIQLGLKDHPAYKDAPNIFSYAKNDGDRQVLRLIFGPLALGRPLLAPPEIPKHQADILRHAVMSALKHPDLLKDATKAQIDINPATAAEAEEIIRDLSATPPYVVVKAKQAMGE